MFAAGVEIGVVLNVDRHEHLDLVGRKQNVFPMAFVAAQFVVFCVKNPRQSIADGSAFGSAHADELVERVLQKDVGREFDAFKIAELVERAQIDDGISDAASERDDVVGGDKHPKRQILNGKIAQQRYVDPGTAGRVVGKAHRGVVCAKYRQAVYL